LALRAARTSIPIVLVLAVTSTFEGLAILANLSMLMLYAMCCVATWQLRRRDVRAGGTPFTVPAPTLVIVLACLVIGWMLTSVTLAEWAGLRNRSRRSVDDICVSKIAVSQSPRTGSAMRGYAFRRVSCNSARNHRKTTT